MCRMSRIGEERLLWLLGDCGPNTPAVLAHGLGGGAGVTQPAREAMGGGRSSAHFTWCCKGSLLVRVWCTWGPTSRCTQLLQLPSAAPYSAALLRCNKVCGVLVRSGSRVAAGQGGNVPHRVAVLRHLLLRILPHVLQNGRGHQGEEARVGRRVAEPPLDVLLRVGVCNC